MEAAPSRLEVHVEKSTEEYQFMTALVAVIAALGFALTASFAHAQAYPAKPVRLVVTSPPGGSQDFLARLLAQGLSPALGQQVLVDNRIGASGVIGVDFVAKAPPDGHTLLLGGAGTVAIVPVLKAKVPFDTLRDFVPISAVASGPFALVVHPSVPANSLKELIAMSKARPGSLNYGSSGAGASPHLAGELLKSMAGIDLIHIPYKGVGPALTDVIAGQIDAMFADVHLVMPHAKAGKLRVLAVTSAERSRAMPQTPTVSEAGVPGYAAGTWFGVMAPTGTSVEIIRRLNAEIGTILAEPSLRERLSTQGIEPRASTPEQFGAQVRNEIEKWRKLAKVANIRLE
jgi:tripartite-type tricarboxylate transporter receptor subunit TctC